MSAEISITPSAPLFTDVPTIALTEDTHYVTPDDSERSSRYRMLSDIYAETEEDQSFEHLLLMEAEEPTSYREAKNEDVWVQAMKRELESIEENKTWYLTELPSGQFPIGLKWVFKVKRDSGGNVVKHKARLVAKGYKQRQGIDFDEVLHR